MRTDPRSLAGTRFDLLIVGAGIHGLFAAYDAAARGMSVAIVDRADIGSGLSFNHQRTIHGGLRDLGAGRLAKARRQMLERRRWVHMAPRMLRPLPFVVATSEAFTRSRLILRAGLLANDLLGRASAAGVPASLRLPPGDVRPADDAVALGLTAGTDRLTGAACWHDYQTIYPDRLNWLVALAAVQAGARLATYVEVTGGLIESRRVTGARVVDKVSGEAIDLVASTTLLAAGSQLPALETLFGVTGAPPFVRAMNMVVSRPAPAAALAAPAVTGRMLTLVPWLGCVLAGTVQSEDAIASDESAPPAAAVDDMIDAVNGAFPRLAIDRGDVRLIHHGLVPAERRHGRLELKPEPEIVRYSGRGTPGLMALVGVKFTTARLAAERAVDLVHEEHGRSARRSVTGCTTLPHGGLEDVSDPLAAVLRDAGIALDEDVTLTLQRVYGTEAPELVRWAAGVGLVNRLASGSAVLDGEVAYAVERAGAVRLADVVLRRTLLGATGHPGREALQRAASVMGDRLGWSPARREDEIRAVEGRYRVP